MKDTQNSEMKKKNKEKTSHLMFKTIYIFMLNECGEWVLCTIFF